MRTRLRSTILALSFALVPAAGRAQAADLSHPPGKFVTVMGKKIWYARWVSIVVVISVITPRLR